jgi:para-nitrobenzyl esterase
LPGAEAGPSVRGVLAALVLAITACGGSSGSRPLAAPGTAITRARTALGTAEGVVTPRGVVAFLGLPYAEPPVGSLRFAPPVPVRAWRGQPLDASAFGPACPQPVEPGQPIYLEQDESCLTLNLWTPSADDRRRPVMVWIHGGGWIYEGTEDPLYSGAPLAARGDVVVVSVEYRLGAFGFSHFPDVPGSGNAGLLDQRLALEWVRDHVAAFGGDPDDVTVFGESAGGASAAALMGLPGASALFRRAIAQSNVSSLTRSADHAKRMSQQLLAAAGADDVAALRALSWPELLEAQRAVEAQNLVSEFVYGPTFDGDVFPVHPLDAVAAGSAAHVPLLTGHNRHEASGWMMAMDFLTWPILVPGATLAAAAVSTEPGLRPGVTIAEATEVYTRNHPGLAPNLVSLAVLTDVFFRMPVLRFADSQLRHQPDHVFVYRFDWETRSSTHPELDVGALHGAELGFVLGAPEGWPEIYGNGGVDAPSGLVEIMMDAWLAFAKTGDPSHGSLPDWPAYDEASRPTMIFDAEERTATSAIALDPDAQTRALWAE